MRNANMLIMIAIAIILAPTTVADDANGLGVNLPLVGRLVGGGNTLFRTAVEVANNTNTPAQVDFYGDLRDLVTGDTIAIDGSLSGSGALAARGAGGAFPPHGIARFEDFVESLVESGMLAAEIRDHGVAGSVLFVFDGKSRSGEGSATARFYNDFGDGTVGVSLKGREISTVETQRLVTTAIDSRDNEDGAPRLYTNLFINNTGLTVDGTGTAGPVTVEIRAVQPGTGAPIGVPMTIQDVDPGQTAIVNNAFQALQIPPTGGETILLFIEAVSGNAALHGLISQVDNDTRDGSVFDMSRADF